MSAVESDPKRLKQILVNLLGNALKFTASGRVELMVSYFPFVVELAQNSDRPASDWGVSATSTANGGTLRFDITDAGVGITDNQQTKLFKPYSQADASVNRNFGGTGLGLVISRRLASMLVDDRRDVRHLARHFLKRAGADVEAVEDGVQALEFMERVLSGDIRPVDVILLDMQMPRLDGYETASRLRVLGFHKPIIALTADAMHGDMSRCLESGCNAYLSKPIDAAALLEMVRKYVD